MRITAVEVGQVVRKKGAGCPEMTVHHVESILRANPLVHCQWFVGYELKAGKFVAEELILVSR